MTGFMRPTLVRRRLDRSAIGDQMDAGRPRVLIDLRGVVKDYVTDAGTFRALDDVSLQVAAGEFIAIVGKSGSGKSTLLNMITAIDRPTDGEVWIADTDIGRLAEGRTARWRGTTVGVVFQFFQLLPTLTVLENVMLPMDFAGRGSAKERHERAMALLADVDMADQANKLPLSTSGGQQQRVAIARALANDPAILVADEPTGNLDSHTADAVFRLFGRLAAAGKTVVMVTHDPDLAMRTHRVVHMVDGRVADGFALELPSPVNLADSRPRPAVGPAALSRRARDRQSTAGARHG